MAGFIVYKDLSGVPVKIQEYATFAEAAAVAVHQASDEFKYDIFSCRDREVLAAKRPELAALLRPQDPEPAPIVEDDEPINPDLRRTAMACSKPKKPGKKPKK